MPPVALYQIPGQMGPVSKYSRERVLKPAAMVMIFTCEGCSGPGTFGVDVSVRQALATGDISKAGRWYCGWVDGQAVCLVNPEAASPVEQATAFVAPDLEPRFFG